MRGKFRVEVRLHELGRLEGDIADLASLKAAHLVPRRAERAKIILSGKLDKTVKVVGVAVTPGARKAIEAAGGSVES
jgi:large subunit ribosomal protein L15